MKKVFLSFLFSFALILTHAQQDYKAKLSALVKHSKSDFSRITGDLVNSDDEVLNYEPEIRIGVGEEFISKFADSKQIFYSSTSKYKDSDSKALENAALEFVKENYPGSKYYIDRENLGWDGAYYRMSVYERTEEDSYPIFIVELQSDIHINTELSIIIPGKTAF